MQKIDQLLEQLGNIGLKLLRRAGREGINLAAQTVVTGAMKVSKGFFRLYFQIGQTKNAI